MNKLIGSGSWIFWSQLFIILSCNYSLFFLSSCWLFIIHNHFFITPLTSCVIRYSWFSKLKYSLFIFYLVPLFIIELPAPKIRYNSLVLTNFITWNRRKPDILRELLISPPRSFRHQSIRLLKFFILVALKLKQWWRWILSKRVTV